jgi:c-di-GMP-binding flagellar brake protein YcgR
VINSKGMNLPALMVEGQEIVIEPALEETAVATYFDRITSHIDELMSDALLIAMPSNVDVSAALVEGVRVQCFVSKYGVRYCFDATVSRRNVRSTKHLMLIDLCNLRKSDRREHVRVETMIEPIRFSVGNHDEMTLKTMEPVIVDMSISGFALSCLQEIPIGARVSIDVELPRVTGPLSIDGDVIRIVEKPENERGRFQMGLKFVNMTERDRDRIAGFILYQQQMMRKKGVL